MPEIKLDVDTIAALIQEAHQNRRSAWDQGLGPEVARHWGGVAGWLRHHLPEGHPLAFKTPIPDEAEENVDA